MKYTKFVILTLVSGALPNFLPAMYAQGWKLMSREEIEAQVRPNLLKQGDEILRFDTCRLSVDTLKEEDDPRTVSFHFRNISQDTVKITRITTTCGCTVADFNRHPLAPGEESDVRLTFHPKNKPGTVDADAWVYTEISPNAPVARLSVCGYVHTDDEWRHLPHSMGHLKLSRKQVVFSKSENSGKARIACANSSDRPMKLKALLQPSYIGFHTEPAELKPGEEGDLVITLDKTKLPRSATGDKKISLIVDGTTGKPSERTIEIIIKN